MLKGKIYTCTGSVARELLKDPSTERNQENSLDPVLPIQIQKNPKVLREKKNSNNPSPVQRCE
jgi:hypothetical protein